LLLAFELTVGLNLMPVQYNRQQGDGKPAATRQLNNGAVMTVADTLERYIKD